MAQLTRKEKAVLAFGSGPYTISHLSADTISQLSAYTISQLSNAIQVQYNQFWASIPKLEKPYTRLLNDINEKKRIHEQSEWPPNTCPAEDNICNTPMCTAGHLVNMAGARGYELKKLYGWGDAAELIHRKTHPELPCQNFGPINQDLALAYIEEMAECEKNNTTFTL